MNFGTPTMISPMAGANPLFGAKKTAMTQAQLEAKLKEAIGPETTVINFDKKTVQVLDNKEQGTTVSRYNDMCRAVEALPGAKAVADGEYAMTRMQFESNGISYETRAELANSPYSGSYSYGGFKLWIFPPREFFSDGGGWG